MKKIFMLANLVLIAGIVFIGVKTFYQALESHMDTGLMIRSETSSKQADITDKNTYPLSYYSAITERNLFNTKTEADIIAEKKPIEVEPPKKTELKLKLWGTITGNSVRPYAVIEDLKTRQQNLYAIGDTIQTASILKISRENVVLLVDGKEESLAMETDETGMLSKSFSSSQAPTPEPPPMMASNVNPPEEIQPPPPAIESEPPSNISLQRSQIQEAINNVNNLMRQARIRPHFQNGKPDGLAITNIQPDSIFTKLGLQPGDVITGVDGQEIKSVDDALKFYHSLKSGPSVVLEIKRRGETRTIQYNIE